MRRVAIVAFLIAGLAHAQDKHAEGYWKYHVPEGGKPFGNDDVVALAQGHHVRTDCSVPWIGGDGNTYCFKDVASRETFLHAPMDYYRQAQAFIAREHGTQPQGSRGSFDKAWPSPDHADATQENSRC